LYLLRLAASALSAVFSIDTVLPKTGTRVTVNTGSAVFSTQVYSIGGTTLVNPSTPVLTIGTQSLNCLTDVVFTANTVTLTFETGTLVRVGSAREVWTFYPRNSVGDWSRRRVRFYGEPDNYV